MSIHCYTPTTVSNHKRTCDAWISIHGNVYDITNFITVHPGGEEVLIEAAGTDATSCFDSIGHSDEAYKLMNDLKIGKLSSKDEVSIYIPDYERAITDDLSFNGLKLFYEQVKSYISDNIYYNFVILHKLHS